MTAPGIYFDWELSISSEDIVREGQKLIEELEKRYDRIGALKKEEVTFENVLKELIFINEELTTRGNSLCEIRYFAVNKDQRDAGIQVQKLITEFKLKVNTREDLFNHLIALEGKTETSTLSCEEKRFLRKLIKNGKRNGLHLTPEKRDLVKELNKKINDFCVQFEKNHADVNTVLEFTAKELGGLPEDFIKELEKAESGKLQVTLKYPHYFPVMRKARNPETRKKMDFAFNTQCIDENTPILEQIVSLRHEAANLLGFPHHAAFATDIQMSKTAENVSNFLTSLVPKLTLLWSEEQKTMLEFKKKECKELGLEFDGKLNSWDLSYYSTMVMEKNYSVDQEKLRQYFPIHVVTEGLFQIYQKLLGLKFEEVKNVKTWHPDVKLFTVTDVESGTLLGYFFLDLYPREGKHSHACIKELQVSAVLRDGTRRLPVIVLITNFTKPTKEKPSLLDHNEVETYFHEFGHVMHAVCSQNCIAAFNGVYVDQDFLECPSQMLENWCWEKEPLKMMSGHYETGEVLPDDLLDDLIKSRLVNVGHFNLRQIILGLFDHAIHTKAKTDVQKEFRDIAENISGIPPQEGTSFACHFFHVVGNYDAKYYGYLWSEVFSADMFHTRFKAEGVLNEKTGMDYRKMILEPGATEDGDVLLRNFLGRDPDQKAFLSSKGIS